MEVVVVRPLSPVLADFGAEQDELGAGRQHTGFMSRTHDLVDRRSVTADDNFPGGRASARDRQYVADRLG